MSATTGGDLSGPFDPFDLHVKMFKALLLHALDKKGFDYRLLINLPEIPRRSLLQKAAEQGRPDASLAAIPQQVFDVLGIVRADLIGHAGRFSMKVDRVSTYPYLLAAVGEIKEERGLDVDCMSCKVPLTAANTTIWRKVLLCSTCAAQASSVEVELRRRHAQALEVSLTWLEQKVISGTIYGLQVPYGAQVPEMRSQEEDLGVPESGVQEGDASSGD
jgi:hypothetical protein